MGHRATRARLVALLALAGVLVAGPAASAAPVTVGHSGWEWGNPLPQGNTLRELDFFGPIGYGVGDFGTLLTSQDDGAAWRGLVSGLTEDLTRVQIIDAGSLVIAGGCAVSRSDDGGSTFRRLPWTGLGSRCRSPVAGISFPTTEIGFVLREDGRVYRTDDGGRSWQKMTAVTLFDRDHGRASATDISFRDASVGLVTTDDGVYRTSDGGFSWTLVIDIPQVGFKDLQLAGSNIAYAVGGGAAVMKSTDDGQSWSAKPLNLDARSVTMTSIRCADATLCLIATEPGDRILRTDDGGASFASETAPAPRTLAVGFASPLRAVAAGTGGVSAVSDDAGVSWLRVDGGLAGSFTRLRGDSGALAFAIGDRGALARTLDGGLSWATVPVSTPDDVVDVFFLDEQTGFVLDGTGALLRTGDGGASWRVTAAGQEETAQAVFALDLDRVVLVGARGIRRSFDGGQTFSAVRRRVVRRAFLFGIDYAGGSLFAYGPTSLLASRDGGRTWRRLGRPDHRPLAVVDFVGSKVGFALGKGGRVWRTRDRGRSWRELLAAGTDGGIDLAAVNEREVYLASNDLFFASGANRPDYLLRTSDGGRSWRPQLVNDSRSINGLLATRDSRGLLLAGGNLLFATASGGDSGGRSIVTIRTRRRLLAGPGKVRVMGRLQPADGGEQMIVSMTAADPRLRQGAVDWEFKSARVAQDGRFSTTWKVRRPSVFVAQWAGDGARRGAGSRALKVHLEDR